MAAINYMDFSVINPALQSAIERRDKRLEVLRNNIDEDMETLGSATAKAVAAHQRAKLVEQYGGDPNDSELNTAKQYYLQTGDPSLISKYEESKRTKALQEGQNAAALKKAEADLLSAKNTQTELNQQKQRDERIDIQSKLSPMQSALADIKVAEKSGKIGTPEATRLIEKYNIAWDELNAAYPAEAKKYNRFDKDGNIVDYSGNVVSTLAGGKSAGSETGSEGSDTPKARGTDAIVKDVNNLSRNLTQANINALNEEVESNADAFTPQQLQDLRDKVAKAQGTLTFNNKVNTRASELANKSNLTEKKARINKINALLKGSDEDKAVAKKLKKLWKME